MASLQYNHRRATKATATDEWWDHRINRPLAGRLVRRVLNTNITPNQITLASGFFGLSCAIAISRAHGSWPVLAGAFLVFAMILDCADGQLARMRGGGGHMGRMWDGYCDWITAVAIHLGLWGFLFQHGFHFFGWTVEGALPTFGIVLVAAAGMALHSGAFDLHKNRYLVLTGQGKSEIDTPEDCVRRRKQTDSWPLKLAYSLYWFYCRGQAAVAADALNSEKPTPQVAAIRKKHLGRHLRILALQGPTLHLVVFSLSCMLSVFNPAGMSLYLFFVVIYANAVLIVASLYRRRMVRALDAELKAHTAA